MMTKDLPRHLNTTTLIIIVISLLFSVQTAQAGHAGTVCFECHYKMNETFNISQGIVERTNCNGCHDLYKGDGGKAHVLHLNICKGCHTEVHTLHVEKKIGCRICHQSPQGWNSSIVSIPAPKEVVGDLYIPESGECSYCHLSAQGARRIHDVHPRQATMCPECHFKSIDMTPPKATEEYRPPSFLVVEFMEMFNGISKSIIMIISNLRTE